MTEQVPTIAFTEPARLGAEPRFEDTTGSSAAYTAVDSTNPLPDDALVPLDDRSLVELPSLRFAIFEDVMNLASAQGAIAAAGHVVAVGTSGRVRACHEFASPNCEGMAEMHAHFLSATASMDTTMSGRKGEGDWKASV